LASSNSKASHTIEARADSENGSCVCPHNSHGCVVESELMPRCRIFSRRDTHHQGGISRRFVRTAFEICYVVSRHHSRTKRNEPCAKQLRFVNSAGPQYVPLLQRSWTLWRELEQKTGKSCLHQTGCLGIGSGVVLDSKFAADHHGLKYEMLGPEEARNRFPGYQVPDEPVRWHAAASLHAAVHMTSSEDRLPEQQCLLDRLGS
jgi:hypothetical protein